MQLKGYQNEILRDLGEFLDLVGKNQNLNLAWQEFWNLRGYSVDKDSFVKPYKTNLNGVIDVCFKVPTGGGKTIIGASSLKVIFDNTPKEKAKFVVWLVPSDTILTQTFENFTNLNHPYAKRLKADFGEVAIYDKEMLLGGENFSEVAVQNQLSIAILSMQSIRSKNKDGRKIYEENGALAKFNTNDEKFEETALISVLRKYNPVVVIDESHNAKSDLSVEMLENLNPSFVLELTATPKRNSNILSFISAKVLKDESMVKLPVIVRNVSDKNRAISESIGHRNYLENLANKIGEKIRPIVLFQAESKNAKTNAEKEEERKTFEKIKQDLIEKFEISKDEIAIKTAEINELKGVNLMSDECKIRYIIT
ncbi:MAG: DEAD/DEAH box helicase family protein, partial [Campylobacter sp.]|nr:DEAD/DEAH box helicase family protein [Campylobacter sp.]